MSTPKRPTRPRDPIELAFQVFQEAVGERPKAYDPAAVPVEPTPTAEPERVKDPAAVALGRKGGLKGGPARAAKLTAEEPSAVGKKGAVKRWVPGKNDHTSNQQSGDQ